MGRWGIRQSIAGIQEAMLATRSINTVPLAPDNLDRAIGLGALLLLAAILTALFRGRAGWEAVPPAVWAHLFCAILAVMLTPVMLWRRRGDTKHRALGYIWVGAMTATAGFSLWIRQINAGHFSLIHILSIGTLLVLPQVVWSARTHNIALHRRTIRGMAIGALLVAGAFTFTPPRILGHWLFGG